MFERNKIDNVDQATVPVEITTDDGDMQKGRLFISVGRNVFDVLNGAGSFLPFTATDPVWKVVGSANIW